MHDSDRTERGRQYLEKIVQLQIPLPATLSEELSSLFHAELLTLRTDVELPENWHEMERFQNLCDVLIPNIISTPRDIKRLIGSFHVIEGMVRGEVDWVDLIGFCALLVKAPGTVNKIRLDSDLVIEDPVSAREAMARFGDDRLSQEERAKRVVPEDERNPAIIELLGLLFPQLGDDETRHDVNSEAICLRRPLLTVLRLGLLPGLYSRQRIEEVLADSLQNIEEELRKSYLNSTISHFIDRLEEVYKYIPDVDHLKFWSAVARFLTKPDSKWLKSYTQMHGHSRNFSDIFTNMVKEDEVFREQAADIFHSLRRDGDITLTSYLIRYHIFCHGLFDVEKSDGYGAFLSPSETETIAREISKGYREVHMAGNLIGGLWDLQPVYTMINTGAWDEECQARMTELIQDDEALDGLILLLFGGHYTTEQKTIYQVVDADVLFERVGNRLSDPAIVDVDETVRSALHKANQIRGE
jgi:hypothetical protein